MRPSDDQLGTLSKPLSWVQQLLEKSRPVRLRQASRGLPQPKRLRGASATERSSCLKKAGRSKAKPTARRPAPSKPRRLLGALYSHGEKPLWFKLNKKKYVLVVLVLVAPPKLTNGKPVCKDFNKWNESCDDQGNGCLRHISPMNLNSKAKFSLKNKLLKMNFRLNLSSYHNLLELVVSLTKSSSFLRFFI